LYKLVIITHGCGYRRSETGKRNQGFFPDFLFLVEKEIRTVINKDEHRWNRE
jgi:hypothetical protein